jgi:signal transduction histidine kinase
MLSSAQQGEAAVGQDSPRLLILDVSNPGATAIAAPLESRGYRVVSVGSGGEALQALRRARPSLAVVAQGRGGSAGSGARQSEFLAAARAMGIPVLEVIEDGVELRARLERSEDIDDWVLRGSSPEELDARIAGLLRRRVPAPIDVPFSAMVVHDLRTPLNVIGLSLRMIEQALPREDAEVEEDLRFIQENLRQIERMLSQLSDYARLFEPGLRLTAHAFDPRRTVDELLENRSNHSVWKGSTVRLDVHETCPAEVSLDQSRARMAIEYALINAGAAAHDELIRLTLRGGPGRWVIEVTIDRPPPSSVTSTELRPHVFERLCGFAADRRGMDLAIVARISELFGGSARFEAIPGRATTIVLDWPVHLAGGSSDD